MKANSALALAPLLAACATAPAADDPQQHFFAALGGLCGQAFEGRVVTSDAADSAMAAQRLVMHVRECAGDTVRIPFHVGSDRSRTWVINRFLGEDGPERPVLRLKHDHRHEGGSEDTLSRYGGDTVAPGTAVRQEFPADTFSQELFVREDIPQSAANVWAIEIHPGRTFAYELRRPGRHFRVEFDLSRPVPVPPPPWGASEGRFGS